MLSFVVILLLLAAGVLLFPQWRERRKAAAELRSAKQDKERAMREIIELEKANSGLENSPDAVEKVAREKFNMCTPGERVLEYSVPPEKAQR